ncbi:DUF6802 family protein [Pseudonocardia sp. H11422]|uniref:DUF6802 family protein n=1 Tax=Pseudonocardia sp. H11422 TaxID=2835866 RepID=UPI001BDC8B0C|nr:DUF6802 family protein [Pseudonocardia sp. H11422]
MRRSERDPALRSPGAVDDLPDDHPGDHPGGGEPTWNPLTADPGRIGVAVADGADTDGDGDPDTLVLTEDADLVLHTDLDGDGLADQVLRIGPDGAYMVGPRVAGPGRALDNPAAAGADAAELGDVGAAPEIDTAPGPWWLPWR